MQSAPMWDAWLEEAHRRDVEDPLAAFRSRFHLPRNKNGDAVIYLDGNSLGLLSQDAYAATQQALDDWRDLAIEGWTEANAPAPWFTLAETLGKRVGALVGAEPGSVIVTGSTTLNLHQILATYFDPAKTDRNRILCDALNFPSDHYALTSHLRLRGLDPATHMRTVSSRDGWTINEADIIAAMTPDVQLAVLPSVLYVSGQLLDMEAVTRAARERGIRIAWDCSHSIGTVEHGFDDGDVDFAFWCHYKYLNSGPGGVGGLYVNRRHWGTTPGLAGWWGSRKERQFDLSLNFLPSEAAGALQIGTPHILSLSPLSGALNVHEEAGIARIRAKSLELTTFLRTIVEKELESLGVTCVTPRDEQSRGGHLALVHPEAARLAGALRSKGVIPDLRPPNVLRFAPVALYTSFADCVEAIVRLRTCLLEIAEGTLRDESEPLRKLVT